MKGQNFKGMNLNINENHFMANHINNNMNQINSNNINNMYENNMAINNINQNNNFNIHNNNYPSNNNFNNNNFNFNKNQENIPKPQGFNNNINFNNNNNNINQFQFNNPLTNIETHKQFVLGGNKKIFQNIFYQSSDDNKLNKIDPNIISVVFVMMQGNKHFRTYKKTDTLKYLLEAFVTSLGLSTNTLKEIYFLYNATNLNNLRQSKTLNELRIGNNSRINVIDINNIIGA